MTLLVVAGSASCAKPARRAVPAASARLSPPPSASEAPPAPRAAATPADSEAGAPERIPRRTAKKEDCIHDVVGDAAARWKKAFGSDVTRAELETKKLGDVDGDQRPEHMVLAESQCGASGNCPHLLYVSHDGCASYAGSLWAEWESETVLPNVRHGLHDIETYLKGGCAGREGTVTVWGWDGKTYRQVRRIDCACPDEHPERHRNPRCPP